MKWMLLYRVSLASGEWWIIAFAWSSLPVVSFEVILMWFKCDLAPCLHLTLCMREESALLCVLLIECFVWSARGICVALLIDCFVWSARGICFALCHVFAFALCHVFVWSALLWLLSMRDRTPFFASARMILMWLPFICLCWEVCWEVALIFSFCFWSC